MLLRALRRLFLPLPFLSTSDLPLFRHRPPIPKLHPQEPHSTTLGRLNSVETVNRATRVPFRVQKGFLLPLADKKLSRNVPSLHCFRLNPFRRCTTPPSSSLSCEFALILRKFQVFFCLFVPIPFLHLLPLCSFRPRFNCLLDGCVFLSPSQVS
jgi:hypothetical protein